MTTRIEETLAHLIAIPSTPNNAQACQEIITYIHDQLQPYGLFIRGDFDAANPWLIATTQDTNTPDILLTAHLDVVPATKYVLEKRDNKFYGRGVYDMKFAAACFLEFVHTHADSLANLNIGFLFTTDEERNSASMKDVLATGLRPEVVFLPDGGGDWAIEKRAKGLYGVRLSAKGTTAHGSRPWEGDHAFHRLLEALTQLRAAYPSTTKDGPTLGLNHLKAGQVINQIPDTAWVEIDFRSFQQTELDAYQKLLSELADAHNLDITVINTGQPVSFDETAPAVQHFLATLKTHLGISEVEYCDAYGGSDARFFAQLGITCIILQPEGGGRHADIEWIKASDIVKFSQLIERWILDKK